MRPPPGGTFAHSLWISGAHGGSARAAREGPKTTPAPRKAADRYTIDRIDNMGLPSLGHRHEADEVIAEIVRLPLPRRRSGRCSPASRSSRSAPSSSW